MQKLICELCRSNDFTRDDQGFFVCDYCRTKYSAEQARSMIVEGTVRVDRSGEAASLLKLASTAVSSGNMYEAVDYANRALEVDPDNHVAWYLKGTAVGWLSTVDFPRIREVHHAFSLAIDRAPAEERLAVGQWCMEQSNQLINGIASASFQRIRQISPSSELWPVHLGLIEDSLGLLGTAYQWCPNPSTFTLYISLATEMIRGTPYNYHLGLQSGSGVHRVAPAYRTHLIERVDWAAVQMRRFDPTYTAPSTKKRWGRFR